MYKIDSADLGSFQGRADSRQPIIDLATLNVRLNRRLEDLIRCQWRRG
jgi:hypothetical protein